jgi:hypothetical protein
MSFWAEVIEAGGGAGRQAGWWEGERGERRRDQHQEETKGDKGKMVSCSSPAGCHYRLLPSHKHGGRIGASTSVAVVGGMRGVDRVTRVVCHLPSAHAQQVYAHLSRRAAVALQLTGAQGL